MRDRDARLDCETLAGFGRDVPERFEVALAETDGTLVCRETLRVLPGRRVVARADFEGAQVLAKIFLGPTAARDRAREEAGAARLRTARIPTPDALGARSIERGEIALYRYLPHAEHLSAAQLPSAAATLARMHDAGLRHDDLHRGNLLVEAGTVYVVDGGSVHALGAPLSTADRTRQLATLLAQFGVDGSAHIDATFAAYRGASKGAPALRRDDLERAYSAALSRRVTRALAKCVRDCSAFRVERRFDRLVVCRRKLWRDLAALIDDPDAAMARGDVLKRGRSSTVVRLALNGDRVVVKRYNVKSTAHALSRLLRVSRAERAWRNANRLEKLGIATAEPLALIEQRFGALRRRAYLVTRALDGDDLSTCDPLAHLDVLVGTFARLRRAGLVHGDAKAKNFVRTEEGFALVDLDSMRAPRRANATRRGQREDLRRFAANWPACGSLERLLVERLAALEGRA